MGRPGRLWTGILLGGLAMGAVHAEALSLRAPVDCDLGKSCFIQNYMDRDAGPGRRDFSCGSMTYDGHKGTDFRVPDYKAMQQGVAVVAAADGVVRRTRDGRADIDRRLVHPDLVQGLEAGNSVVVSHPGGWETQYSHLRQGGVRVKKGQKVKAGDPLGLIGLSGFTEFPHVHFEVRFDGKPVDPFTGPEKASGCKAGPGALWDSETLKKLVYRPTGIINLGFAAGSPGGKELIRGEGHIQRSGPELSVLVFWVNLYGVKKGDRMSLRLVGPDGKVLAARDARLNGNRTPAHTYAGRKRPRGGWPTGLYRGLFKLTRPGRKAPVVAATRTMRIDKGSENP